MDTISCDRLKEIIDQLDPELKKIDMGDSMEKTMENFEEVAAAIKDHIIREEPQLDSSLTVKINATSNYTSNPTCLLKRLHDAAANHEVLDTSHPGMRM